MGGPFIIAEGIDPEAGTWELSLSITNKGPALGIRLGGTRAIHCCLEPLQEAFRLDSWGTSGDGPGHATAIGSHAFADVRFHVAGNVVIRGRVFSVPNERLGIPKIGLVLVPAGVPLEGELVGYDHEGNELGRAVVTSDLDRPPGAAHS